MNQEIQELRNEIVALASQAMASEALLFWLMTALRDIGQVRPDIFETAFEDATNSLVVASHGSGSRQLNAAADIVEKLRNEFLSAE